MMSPTDKSLVSSIIGSLKEAVDKASKGHIDTKMSEWPDKIYRMPCSKAVCKNRAIIGHTKCQQCLDEIEKTHYCWEIFHAINMVARREQWKLDLGKYFIQEGYDKTGTRFADVKCYQCGDVIRIKNISMLYDKDYKAGMSFRYKCSSQCVNIRSYPRPIINEAIQDKMWETIKWPWFS